MKAVGMPGTEVTDDQIAYMQDLISKMFDQFVSGVSSGRGISPAAIRAMDAKVYIGADAKRAGLVDTVGSFDTAWRSIRSLSEYGSRAHIRQRALMQKVAEQWS
jgi:protease-4